MRYRYLLRKGALPAPLYPAKKLLRWDHRVKQVRTAQQLAVRIGLLCVALISGTARSLLAAPESTPAADSSAELRYSSAWVYKTLSDYHRRYPKLTRLMKLGTSHEGRPIWGLAIGSDLGRGGAGRPAVLLNGAHHGIEPLSIELALDAVSVLLLRSGERRTDLRPDKELDAKVMRWLSELVVYCVPVVNPDGIWALQHGNPRSPRKNGRKNPSAASAPAASGAISHSDGVDLNRNYPFKWGFLGEKGSSSTPASAYYRGPSPGSEPETQAMMRLADSEHFAASISYHTGNVTVLAPYTIDGVPSPTPNEAWTVAEELVAGLPDHPQGKPWAVRKMIYPVDGTDQDFLRARYGTLALLVEGARKDTAVPDERRAIVLSARPLWMRLLDRFLDGPSVSGRVVDAAGNPVAAVVSIDEIKTASEERWTTRCRDGRFDRYLPAPGRYTVRVQVTGQPDVTRVIDVATGRTQIELTASPDPSHPEPASCPPAPKFLP